LNKVNKRSICSGIFRKLQNCTTPVYVVTVGGTNGLAKCARKDGSESRRIFFDEHKPRVVDGFEVNFVDARNIDGRLIFGLRNDDFDSLLWCQTG